MELELDKEEKEKLDQYLNSKLPTEVVFALGDLEEAIDALDALETVKLSQLDREFYKKELNALIVKLIGKRLK